MQVSSLKTNITVLQMLLNLRKFCTLSLKKKTTILFLTLLQQL